MNLTEESKDMDYELKYEFAFNIHHITKGSDSMGFSNKISKEEAITKAKVIFTQWNHERLNPQLYSKYFNVTTGFKVLKEDVDRNPVYYANSQEFDEYFNEEKEE